MDPAGSPRPQQLPRCSVLVVRGEAESCIDHCCSAWALTERLPSASQILRCTENLVWSILAKTPQDAVAPCPPVPSGDTGMQPHYQCTLSVPSAHPWYPAHILSTSAHPERPLHTAGANMHGMGR